MKKNLVETKVNLTPEMHEWFKERSAKTGVSMKSCLFLALETYVQQQVMLPQLPEMLEQLRNEKGLDSPPFKQGFEGRKVSIRRKVSTREGSRPIT